MRKLILTVVAIAGLTFAASAGADHYGSSVVAVTDPTPSGEFTGNYVVSKDDPATEENEYQEGTQQGYVGVYENGAVACNGNPEITRPDDGSPLVGYIWVGPGMAASNPTAAAPGDAAGAGNNHEDEATGEPTGHAPCPEGDPSGVNE